VPLWSFVRVTESRQADIPVGGRYFGYVPMASQHTTRAEASPRGFVDTSTQRAFLPSWYRTFQSVGEPDELDDLRALMRPVFPASFNLADLVERHVALGARSLIVTSASSKTAIGLADELRARRVDIATTAVTSMAHEAFVKRLGLHDEVATYETIGSVTATSPAVFIDFTGSATWLRAVYQRLGSSLSYCALVGFTHPDPDDKAPPGMPDPQPEFFFTPVVEEQVIAQDGAPAYYARYHDAETRFLRRMSTWLDVRPGQGPADLVDAFQRLLRGDQAPDVSPVLTP
jgi:hypothetical protein